MTNVITATNVLELIERTELEELVTVEVGYQPLLDREVVVKRMAAKPVGDPRLRGRFLREARSLAALRHQSIVQVYDAGMEEDLPYVVLEHLHGMTVQQRMEQLLAADKRIEFDQVIQIVEAVAQAMDYAHQRGVVIYDVAPSNIVLTRDGRIVLAGLGQPVPDNLLAAAPQVLAYAAPELLFGGEVDRRAGVYALGVLTYHLLSGRPPFEGVPLCILTQKQQVESVSALDERDTQIASHPELTQVVRRATNRESPKRYASAAGFRDALVAAVHEHLPLKAQVADSIAVCRHDSRRSTLQAVVRERVTAIDASTIHVSRPPARAQTTSMASQDEIAALAPDRETPGGVAADYTVLVPLPDAEDSAAVQSSKTSIMARGAASTGLWIAGMILVAFLAIITAINLG